MTIQLLQQIGLQQQLQEFTEEDFKRMGEALNDWSYATFKKNGNLNAEEISEKIDEIKKYYPKCSEILDEVKPLSPLPTPPLPKSISKEGVIER